MTLPDPKQIKSTAILLLFGLMGGLVAWLIGLPLPFMIGGLLTTIPFVVRANSKGDLIYFPRLLRMWFVGVIGVMIGGTFTPELVSILPSLGISLIAVVVYVFLAHLMGFGICRWVGGYDRVTAFYASMPGGLIEALALGERAGGDVRILTMTHFLRILTVVTVVPLAFYILSGNPVGSSAGQGFKSAGWDWLDIIVIFGLTGLGLAFGQLLHIPATHLMGPMLLSSIVFGSGLIEAQSPDWVLFLAQLVVGVGLGAQFKGASWRLFIKVFWTSLAQVLAMIGLSLVLAMLVVWLGSDFDIRALMLSFAPGGVSEMGLIALSLSISPVIVAAHHVFRIFLTVFVAVAVGRYAFKPRS